MAEWAAEAAPAHIDDNLRAIKRYAWIDDADADAEEFYRRVLDLVNEFAQQQLGGAAVTAQTSRDKRFLRTTRAVQISQDTDLCAVVDPFVEAVNHKARLGVFGVRSRDRSESFGEPVRVQSREIAVPVLVASFEFDDRVRRRPGHRTTSLQNRMGSRASCRGCPREDHPSDGKSRQAIVVNGGGSRVDSCRRSRTARPRPGVPTSSPVPAPTSTPHQ
ncbi:hypothetical protein ABN028_34615 [Actinopolymorpha sp. B17G11]|uniref:hypothetical protein n=1 Tax=Actinopolymorpha sp. B17G11 TaxID=3160861 RepID=UPI0032E4311C